MTTTVLNQTIEYDQSARAWGLYGPDAQLIKYHDSHEDALLASLPDDIRQWAETIATKFGPRFRSRVIKGAAIAARDRQEPCIIGNPLERGNTFRITGDQGIVYTVNLPPGQTCSCPDFQEGGAPFFMDFATSQHRRIYCKHILALSCYFAMLVKEADSLWNIAQKTINWKQAWPVGKPWIIWQHKERSASLTRIQSEPDDGPHAPRDDIYLSLSGHNRMLRVASLKYSILTNEPYFEWTANREHYEWWAKRIENG
jgi:hypothetical protein